jgi:hypothetical protein
MDFTHETSVDWHTDAIRTEHEIDFAMELKLNGIFESDDRVTELVIRGAEIRALLMELLAEQILPGILTQLGKPTSVPGLVHVTGKHIAKATVGLRRRDNPTGPESIGYMQVKSQITTDREMHALQAVGSSIGNIADSFAEALMAGLRSHLLGVKSAETESRVRVTDGELSGYEAKTRTTGGAAENN